MELTVTSAPEQPPSEAQPIPPRATRRAEVDWSWAASLFVLCGILGALLGISFKAQHIIRQKNVPATNYEGMVQQYLIVKSRADDGERTIQTLQSQVNKLESAVSPANDRLAVISQDLRSAKFLAGLTDATGPGVIVTLNDSHNTVPDLPADIPNPGLIHDVDINAVTNELKAAGAEAISINFERLAAATAVRCAGPTVFVNNTPQTPPYVIRAIGKPDTLEAALKLPGGVYDSIAKMDPSMIRVETATKLLVPAYTGPIQPRYAKPIFPTAGG